MEMKGLLFRVRDREKKNMWRVSLTECGKGACRDATRLDCIHAAMCRVYSADKHVSESPLKSLLHEQAAKQRADGAILGTAKNWLVKGKPASAVPSQDSRSAEAASAGYPHTKVLQK